MSMSRILLRKPAPGFTRIHAGIVHLLAALLVLAAISPSGYAGVTHFIYLQIDDEFVSDKKFGLRASDLNEDLALELEDFGPAFNATGVPGGQLTGSLGRDGSLGVNFLAFGQFPHVIFDDHVVMARVLISSDDFINLSDRPLRVVSRVIVDGGALQIHGARDVKLSYELGVSFRNKGAVGPSNAAEFVGAFDSTAGGTLTADLNGDLEFTTFGGGLDAFFNPLSSTVTIPLSFQTFDFGVLGPGDRGIIYYGFTIKAEFAGLGILGLAPLSDIPQGIFAQYSDPLSLSGNPGFTIEFQPTATPVPVPSTLALALSGLLALGLVRFVRRRRSAG